MGIFAAVIDAVATSVLGETLAAGIGEAVGSEFLGTALAGGIEGSLGGAAMSAITGGDPLQGLEGGLLGGAIGAGLGGGLVGDALGGAIGSYATGGNPLMGALGGAAGDIAGPIGQSLGITGPGGLTSSLFGSGGGGSAAGAASSSLGGAGLGSNIDLTTSLSQTPAIGGSIPQTSTPFSADFGLQGGGTGLGPMSQGGGPTSGAGDQTATSSFSAVQPAVNSGVDVAGAQTSKFDINPALTPQGAGVVPLPGASAATAPLFGADVNLANANFGGGAPNAGGNISGTAQTPTFGQIGKDFTSGSFGQGVSDIGSKIAANPGTVLTGLGLGYEALQGQQQPKGMQALLDQLHQQQASTAALSQGVLPQGVQQTINQVLQGTIANTKQQYQKMGLGNSTMEAQAVQNAYQTAASQASNIAMQMLQSGLNENQISSQLITAMMGSYQNQNSGMTSAIANFARALGGSTNSIAV